MGKQLLLISTSAQPLDGLTARLAGCGFAVRLARDLDAAVRSLQNEAMALVVVHGAQEIEDEGRGRQGAQPCAPTFGARNEAITCLRLLCDRPLLVIDEQPSEDSTVSALRAGADTVLPAQLSRRELARRIDALLRRSARRWNAASIPSARRVEPGHLAIDLKTQRFITQRGVGYRVG